VPYTAYSFDRSNDSATATPRDDPYKIITVIPQEDIDTRQTLEPELEMLTRIPKFHPIVKPSAWPFGTHETAIGYMNPRPLLTICAEHQSFSRKAANVISNQQKMLCTKMKQKENQCVAAAKRLAGVVEDVKNFETKLREVDRIKLQIETTKQLMDSLMSITEELCCLLPTQDRMTSLYFYTQKKETQTEQAREEKPS